jgi:uncharacterized protein YdeI (YjbR/CyaY-like superfamily)
MTSELKAGVVHELPADLTALLSHDTALGTAWNQLTPLARNEWICWVTHVKKPETRQAHLVRLAEELRRGKKRPCCWPGCPHRKAVQSSAGGLS